MFLLPREMIWKTNPAEMIYYKANTSYGYTRGNQPERADGDLLGL